MADYNLQQLNAAAQATSVMLADSAQSAIAAFHAQAAAAQATFHTRELMQPLNAVYSIDAFHDATSVLNEYLSSAASYGGDSTGEIVLTLPPGAYQLTDTLVVPGNRPITIIGSGKYATQLYIYESSDLGMNRYIIDVQNPSPSGRLRIQDLNLLGPNTTLATKYNSSTSGQGRGTSPANMSGVHASVPTFIDNCSIQGFYSGVVIDSPNVVFNQTELGNNFYGAYFASGGNPGGHAFFECGLTAARFSSIGCANNAVIANSAFYRCHNGWCSYCFFREAGGTAGADWIVNCNFDVLNWENVGNAAFWDDGYNAAIRGNSFVSCGEYGVFNAGYSIDTMPFMYYQNYDQSYSLGPCVYVGSFHDNYSMNSVSPTSMMAGQIYNNYFGGSDAFAVEGSNPTVPPIFADVVYGNAHGDMGQQYATFTAPINAAFTPGQLVEQSGTAHGCQLAQGTSQVLGVVYAAPSVTWTYFYNNAPFIAMPANQAVYVTQTGPRVNVLCDGSVTGPRQLVKAAANGTVSQASSLSDGQVIGVTQDTPSGGSVPVVLRLHL